MAPKRKPHGDGVGESPDDEFVAKPSDDTKESSAEFARPVYLVAARDDDLAAYSVLEIDAAAAAGGDEPPRIRTVAALPLAEPGMSFVAAHSEHGSWIVGVGGGLRAGTIIFDPRTMKTFHGPRLGYPKHEPVLISHGGELQQGCALHTLWPLDLLEPPATTTLLPRFLNPYEFRSPPEISVSSYAVVGSYILISPQPELVVGTHAFHVVNKTWEKIHDENLPFVGQAVPVGGSLFAAGLVSNQAITGSASLFHLSIDDVSSWTSDAVVSTPSLSIQELKMVASEDKIPWPFFCPLGKGSFCLIRVVSSCRRHRHKANYLKKRLRVSLTTLTDREH
ncbi:hypothetical protein SETIT_7G313000v2 [Setaria italica]|uniref:Uncharacterized protein n=1 Tax=Setaria italica TaxID=4555 RepID=A0A368S1R6_SETIT|nr:hypothetical protein SETIT_7G313000v2 [Setaria italica]